MNASIFVSFVLIRHFHPSPPLIISFPIVSLDGRAVGERISAQNRVSPNPRLLPQNRGTNIVGGRGGIPVQVHDVTNQYYILSLQQFSFARLQRKLPVQCGVSAATFGTSRLRRSDDRRR